MQFDPSLYHPFYIYSLLIITLFYVMKIYNKDEEWMLQLRKASTALMRLSSNPPSSIVPMPNLSLENIIAGDDALPFTTNSQMINAANVSQTEAKSENLTQDDDVQIVEGNQQETTTEEKTDDADDAYAEISDEKSNVTDDSFI